MSVGLHFWFVCHTHHTKWKLGILVSETWNGSEEQERKNAILLYGYEKVDPIYRQRVTCPRCQADITVKRHGGHSPLCRHGDGTMTSLSDDVVAQVLKFLDDQNFQISASPPMTYDMIPI